MSVDLECADGFAAGTGAPEEFDIQAGTGGMSAGEVAARYPTAMAGLLAESCKTLLGYLERGELPAEPDHSCSPGPEAACDGNCVDYYYFCASLIEARRILRLYELSRTYLGPTS